eukprot:scaffold719_cov359-Prasinococcus_capsulatus_cf.AAC.3
MEGQSGAACHTGPTWRPQAHYVRVRVPIRTRCQGSDEPCGAGWVPCKSLVAMQLVCARCVRCTRWAVAASWWTAASLARLEGKGHAQADRQLSTLAEAAGTPHEVGLPRPRPALQPRARPHLQLQRSPRPLPSIPAFAPLRSIPEWYIDCRAVVAQGARGRLSDAARCSLRLRQRIARRTPISRSRQEQDWVAGGLSTGR